VFCSQAFLRNYTWVGVGRVGSTVNAITQTFELATNDKRHKLELLIQALTKAPPPQLTLVFVQKKRTASWVAGQLTKTDDVASTALKLRASTVIGHRASARTHSRRSSAVTRR